MYSTRLLDSVGEGEGGMFWENSTETSILSRVKQSTSPGWMHETSAQGWCTGKTQRDGMGREVGGGSGWGTHVNPWLIHVNVWQKPLQYCKVISLQLIKINEKNKNKKDSGCWGAHYYKWWEWEDSWWVRSTVNRKCTACLHSGQLAFFPSFLYSLPPK